MSEFINARERAGLRWSLLTTASAIALFGTACGASASDNDRPPFWIELGGQFSQVRSDEEVFAPSFLSASPFDAISHVDLEKNPHSSWDGTAKIAFEPEETGWVFSAAIVYGKSDRRGAVNQQTAHGAPGYPVYEAYQNFDTKSSQSHAVADFQAGRDVGLGMFGNGGRSVVSLGVRYAQLSSQGNTAIQSQPTNIVAGAGSYHKFYATFAAKRKFTGVGPSLSWDASADLMGNPSESNLTFDWGLKGALLFGRQRAQIHHQTTNEGVMYHTTIGNTVFIHHPISQHNVSPFRNRQVTVPNFGGFAGVSWRYPGAKVSVGYRADFFFGAMDGGIDVAHRENVGFYGPFATVSVGIGG